MCKTCGCGKVKVRKVKTMIGGRKLCGCGRRMRPFGDGQWWCPGYHKTLPETVTEPPLEAFVATQEWVKPKE